MVESEAEEREADLVARAQAGDDAAFAALCKRYEAQLRGRVERRLSPAVRRKISAGDVLQEAHLVAHRRLSEFEDRGRGAFGAWLLRIVELKAHEAVRRYTKTAMRDAAAEVTEGRIEAHGSPQGREPSPSQNAMAAEFERNAAEAMQRLPDHYRMVVHLVQGEGLTLGQAAERLGRSRDSVKGLYARALALLARDLGLSREDR